jgi:hypothetical protein
MRLLVGIPAYNGMLHIDCVNTLLGLRSIGIPSEAMMLGNESLITRGRNTIFSYFIHAKEYTHLLFLDADVGMNPRDIKKMLDSGKDVIGAPVRLKGVDKKGNPVYNVGKTLGTSFTGLLKVEKVGTAALMLSRHACEKFIEESNPATYSKVMNNGVGLDQVTQYDAFQVGVIDGEYQSEDFWFCVALRKIGFDVFVDTKIHTVHNGVIQLG